MPLAVLLGCFFVGSLIAPLRLHAQNGVTVRVLASNLTGNSQTYGDSQIRILQGLKPDVACMQEFKYGGNTPVEIRAFVDTAFGPNFEYTRETNALYDIPNGIVSRYPITAAGSWDDTQSPNRGFAWAKIRLPGTNELLAVSVHLLTSDSVTRGMEAAELRAILQTNTIVPASGWIVVAGDFNTDNRGEAAINALTNNNFLSDRPIPTDQVTAGDSDTNMNRNKPYDYVLPSFSFAICLTNVVIGTYSFPNGLVFDSRTYPNLANVSPVLLSDSALGQHMAVVKDFLLPDAGATTNPPAITAQPQSQTNYVGADVTLSVVASGTGPLSYQWLFNTTSITGATSSFYTVTNIQTNNAGEYSVVITNLAGTTTSSNALLTVTTQPVITTPPQSLTVNVGDNALFTVGAAGQQPLAYQWRFAGTNLPGEVSASFTRASAEIADAGEYTVVITNFSGSVTSDSATLTVNPVGTVNVIAQWDFNSVPPDSVPATGTTAPSVGSGVASLVTALTPSFAGGSTTDPASADNSGWNITSYPAATSGNKTAGVRFNVSTLGKQNVSVRWDQRVSNTGSKYSRLQYTTNGTTFQDFPTAVAVVTAAIFEAHTNNLSLLPGVNNNPQFGFRIVNEFANTAIGTGAGAYAPALSTSIYATSGTTRFDMVTLLGDSISTPNPPAAAPVLTDAMLSGSYLQLFLTGSVGSNYIVQAASDPSVSNWLSLQTNAAPFTFTDTNANLFEQRFYRGLVAP